MNEYLLLFVQYLSMFVSFCLITAGSYFYGKSVGHEDGVIKGEETGKKLGKAECFDIDD